MAATTRRDFFRSALAAGISSALSAIAPAPAQSVRDVVFEKEYVDRPVEAAWADEWPPTAKPGKLIRCDAEPGYYTTGGVPALFVDPSGFPEDRHLDPPEGMHVYEVDYSPGIEGRRYAVVRHQKG